MSVDSGADCSVVTNAEQTVLGMCSGCPTRLKLFLNLGLDVNLYTLDLPHNIAIISSVMIRQSISADKTGATPLFKYVRFGDLDGVKLLIEHGASVNAKNIRDETAFDVADKINLCESFISSELMPC